MSSESKPKKFTESFRAFMAQFSADNSRIKHDNPAGWLAEFISRGEVACVLLDAKDEEIVHINTCLTIMVNEGNVDDLPELVKNLKKYVEQALKETK